MNIAIPPRMTINGEGTDAAETFSVFNPADASVLAQVPDISQAQLDEVIAAARTAFPGWRDTAIEERSRLLGLFAEAISAESERLARLLTLEQGKPFGDAATEIAAAAYWIEEVRKLRIEDDVHVDDAQRRIVTRHVPLGVVAALVPWNFRSAWPPGRSRPHCWLATVWCLNPHPTRR